MVPTEDLNLYQKVLLRDIKLEKDITINFQHLIEKLPTTKLKITYKIQGNKNEGYTNTRLFKMKLSLKLIPEVRLIHAL